MDKVKKFARYCFGIIFLIGIVCIYLVLTSIKVWSSEEFIGSYSTHLENDGIMNVAFLPDNYVVFYYVDKNDFEEIAITKMKGVYGKKLFHEIWLVDNPKSILKYKIYKGWQTPVSMEIDIVDRKSSDNNQSIFQDVGARSYSTVCFGDSTFSMDGMFMEPNEQAQKIIETKLSEWQMTIPPTN